MDVWKEEARAELEILTAQDRQSIRQPELSVRLAGTTAGEAINDQERVVTVLALVSAGIMPVFVLTCTNVGNLFLARNLSRRGEIAVRLSLGATRMRVVQQLVVEGLVLAAIAGVAAFLATMAVPPLFRLVDEEEAIAAMFRADWRVAAFTSVFVILTCLLVSLAPALHTSRIAWRGAGAGVPPATGNLRRGILAAQIAVATVLVLSATLLTRGIERALAISGRGAAPGNRDSPRPRRVTDARWPCDTPCDASRGGRRAAHRVGTGRRRRNHAPRIPVGTASSGPGQLCDRRAGPRRVGRRGDSDSRKTCIMHRTGDRIARRVRQANRQTAAGDDGRRGRPQPRAKHPFARASTSA